jgi:hypothetical protein
MYIGTLLCYTLGLHLIAPLLFFGNSIPVRSLASAKRSRCAHNRQGSGASIARSSAHNARKHLEFCSARTPAGAIIRGCF